MGLAFDTWLRGMGMEVAGCLIDLVRQMSSQPPVCLDEGELRAAEEAKAIIRANLKSTPTILDLCRKVGMNKNRLQSCFRLTEGKSVAEYTRMLRMERTLDLLEDETLSVGEAAEAVGYHGISNLYTIFRRTFGDTPAIIRGFLGTGR